MRVVSRQWVSTRVFYYAICAMLVALSFHVEAQQPGKIARIGYLSANSRAAMATRTEAFQQGLRELGYVDGKTIVIEYRYAEGNPDRIRTLAAELVRLNLDIIVVAAG